MLLFMITGVIAVMFFLKMLIIMASITLICVCVYIYHITMFVQNRNNILLYYKPLISLYELLSYCYSKENLIILQ